MDILFILFLFGGGLQQVVWQEPRLKLSGTPFWGKQKAPAAGGLGGTMLKIISCMLENNKEALILQKANLDSAKGES